jgi:hypothetical protein
MISLSLDNRTLAFTKTNVLAPRLVSYPHCPVRRPNPPTLAGFKPRLGAINGIP